MSNLKSLDLGVMSVLLIYWDAWVLYRDRAWKESPKFCQIILERPDGIYVPGEIVAGLVNIVINKPQRIRGILIHYRGLCETFLIDHYCVRYSIQYSGKQEYFNVSEYCKGGKKHPVFTLEAGAHSYRFIYKLPERLPSSFKGDAGYIAYFVEVILHRAFKKNLNNLQEFTVTPKFDLNAYPKLKLPVKEMAERRFIHCCRGGLIEATLELPKTGYHVGEVINATVYADNCSTVRISQANLQFRLVSRWKSHSTVTILIPAPFKTTSSSPTTTKASWSTRGTRGNDRRSSTRRNWGRSRKGKRKPGIPTSLYLAYLQIVPTSLRSSRGNIKSM